MQNVKIYIIEQLAENLCNLTKNSLSRIIAGEYRPSLHVAKWLAFVTGTQTAIWNDPASVAKRQQAIKRLAKKNGMFFQIGRGRPRKVKP